MKNSQVSYNEFMLDVADKTKELMDEYNKLSPEDQRKATAVAQRILYANGVAGIMKFIADPLGF